MKIKQLVITIAALGCVPAEAADALNLGRYSVTGIYAIEGTAAVTGLEASAVTYARDRGTLFFVGDEGKGVVEISRTGATLGAMAFTGWGARSTRDGNDSEGLTYLGNGQLVVAEERFQNAYSFAYAAGSSIDLGAVPFASIGPTIGNVGIEGISYDPRNGGFVAVKQDNPAQLQFFNSLPFSTSAAPDVVPNVFFTGASSLFGLDSLSDVQTLSPVDSLLGTAAADNLLLLSVDSRRLVEIDRLGNIKSFFDLSTILPFNAIEGVTVDENGTIYLVAEHDQRIGAPPDSRSQLIVLTAVPEPETYAMMLAGLGLLGFVVGRRRKAGI